MLNNKTIAVIVPAYNEEHQIAMVLETMPDFVDRIIVIDDHSEDSTGDIVKGFIKTEKSKNFKIENVRNNIKPNRYNRADILLINRQKDENKYYSPFVVFNENEDTDRIILIRHKINAGKGAGIATGFKWAKDHGIDCTATMDGDGQMDPDELKSICTPVVEEGIDYVKGNRLIHRSAPEIIPTVRYFGNSILSILT